MEIYDLLLGEYVDISKVLNCKLSHQLKKSGNLTSLEFKIISLLHYCMERKVNLLFHNGWEGGADSYLNNFISSTAEESIFVVEYISLTDTYKTKFISSELQFEFEFFSMIDVASFFEKIKIKKIYINELAGYKDIYSSLELITKIKEKTNSELVFLLHDYYCICPSLFLTTFEGKYCDLPDYADCGKCRSYKYYRDYKSMEMWRKEWGVFLKSCDEIVVFCNNSIDIFSKVFGHEFNITIRPHKVDYIKKIYKSEKITQTINIGFLGRITKIKGLNIVKEMANIIERENLKVRLKIIGHTSPPIEENEYLFQTGKYRIGEIGDLALKNDIDIFFITSICPETFSYTTEEVMQLGVPVACFDIGAPSERVIRYDKGIIISEIDAKISLDEIVNYVSSKIVIK